MPVIPNDSDSRKLIVSDINSNYFVEASAGSGKTYSLVLRMVAMIEGNDAKGIAPVPVDQICTITFTKAAAAEFFSRFQRALSLRSVSKHYDIDNHLGPKTEVTMERCRIALANIDLCFLGTIDAFCNMVAHELPTELDIPSDSEVISNDERVELLQEEYEKILKDPSHPCHQKALVFEDLFYDSRGQFAAAVSSLGDLRNADIPYDVNLVNVDINTYFTKKEKDDFLRYVKGLCSKDISYNNKMNGERNDNYKYQTTLRTLYPRINKSDWSDAIGNIDFALKQIKYMDKVSKDVLDTDLTRLNLFNVPEKISSRTVLKYSEDAQKCFDTIRNKVDDYKFAILFDLVMSMLNKIFDELKEKGKLGFFDYLYYLTEAFKKDAKGDRLIIEHILKRHSRFLLDESQDTNPLQTELFFYLTGTNKFARDWTDAKPKEGSLFIVGDPKQSIYGFRNANVQAFNKVKDIFAKENKLLILTKNFRSKEILKEWFNTSMNDVLNHGVEALYHQPIPIDANKKKEQSGTFDYNGKKVQIYQGVYKYSVKDMKTDYEAVAKLIIDMVNNPNKLIQVKNKKTDEVEIRPITFGDIRVVPRGTDVKGFVDSFNRYNIPVVIEADIPFERSKTLLNAVDITCLLKEPNDKAALFKVLYGDLFKLNDLDIIQMKIDGFKYDISNPFKDDGLPVVFSNKASQEVINLLSKLWNETKDFSLSSTLLYVLNNKELNIYDKISTDFLEYTFFLLEKIKEREEAGLISGIEQFKEYVYDFTNGGVEDNRTIRFQDNADRVILANLHKVKGLQAPIVILCHPDKGGNRSIRHVDYSSGKPVASLSALGSDDSYGFLVERHSLNPQDQQLWDEYEKAEKERVEYVGATRAESVLIVAEKEASGNKSNSPYPNFNPWEDLLRNIPDSQKISVPEVTIPEADVENASLNNPSDYDNSKNVSVVFASPSKRAKDYKIESADNNLDEIKEEVPQNEQDTSSTVIGTIIHRLMECLVSSKGSYSSLEDLVKQIVEEYNASEHYDILMGVAKTITSGGFKQKGSKINQDILSMLYDAEERYCETPFSYKKGNEVISGVIDLIYKDQDGYRIIDYKTNKNDNVAYLEKEYAEQLNDYINVLKEMGIVSDAHIYHISYPRKEN